MNDATSVHTGSAERAGLSLSSHLKAAYLQLLSIVATVRATLPAVILRMLAILARILVAWAVTAATMKAINVNTIGNPYHFSVSKNPATSYVADQLGKLGYFAQANSDQWGRFTVFASGEPIIKFEAAWADANYAISIEFPRLKTADSKMQHVYGQATRTYPVITIEDGTAPAVNTANIDVNANAESLKHLFSKLFEASLKDAKVAPDRKELDSIILAFSYFLDQMLRYPELVAVAKYAMFFDGDVQFWTLWAFFFGILSCASAFSRARASRLSDRRVDSFFKLPHFALGALPMLGFYGTIIGIAAALAAVGETKSPDLFLATLADGKISSKIGIAFETTKFAIVLTLLLGFLVALLERHKYSEL